MDALSITYVRPDSIAPAARNARRHSKKQIRKLGRAIGEFGFKVPILCTRDGVIVAGHGRLEAAKLRGGPVGLNSDRRWISGLSAGLLS